MSSTHRAIQDGAFRRKDSLARGQLDLADIRDSVGHVEHRARDPLGSGSRSVAPNLMHLAAFTAVFAPVGALAFARALSRAREDGSLSSY